jgi:hypothetical protein
MMFRRGNDFAATEQYKCKYRDPSPFDCAQGQDDDVGEGPLRVERRKIGDSGTGNDWNKQRQIQGSFTTFRMTTWGEGLLRGGEVEDRRQKNRQRLEQATTRTGNNKYRDPSPFDYAQGQDDDFKK